MCLIFLPRLKYYIKRVSSSQRKSFMILRKSSMDICDTTFAQNILRLHTPYIQQARVTIEANSN